MHILPSFQVIVLLGPPGSGKGTQAKRIAAAFKLPHISTGDLFRDHISRQTPLGKEVQEMIHAGRLPPDQYVFDMLFERVKREDCSSGYILDGFPRNIAQAEKLDQSLKNSERFLAINFSISNEEVVKRISGRVSCPSCGHVYNIFYSPSKKEGVCDVCGTALIQRSDDRLEVIEERLRVYHEQTAPVIHYYALKKQLVSVNAEESQEKVFQKLLEVLP